MLFRKKFLSVSDVESSLAWYHLAALKVIDLTGFLSPCKMSPCEITNPCQRILDGIEGGLEMDILGTRKFR